VVPAVLDVVEPDNRDVVRHLPAGLGQGPQRAEREQVVEAEHRVRRFRQLQQGPHRGGTVVAVVPGAGQLQRRVVRQARGLQCLAVPAPPDRTGTGAAADTDRGDPAAAERDQVRGRVVRRLDRVDGDVVQLAAAVPFAQQEQGFRVIGGLNLRRRGRDRREDDAVDQLPAHAVQHEPFGVQLPLGLVDQHRDAAPFRRPADRGRDLGEVRRRHLGHGECDEVRAALAQRPGGHVRPIAQLGDRPFDLAPGRLGDVRVGVDHVRDRLDRYAGSFRHILQPCRRHRSLPPSPSDRVSHGPRGDRSVESATPERSSHSPSKARCAMGRSASSLHVDPTSF